jgi:hypothetical protein
LQRLLPAAGGEDVVDHDDGAGRVRQVGTAARSTRVSSIGLDGRLEEHRLVGAASAAAHCVEVAAVDQSVCDAPQRGSRVDDDPVAGAEQRAAGDHAVAGPRLAEPRAA